MFIKIKMCKKQKLNKKNNKLITQSREKITNRINQITKVWRNDCAYDQYKVTDATEKFYSY